MPRITLSDVQKNLGNAEIYDIVNAIRNSDPNFREYVPLADANNVAEIGQAIMIHQTTQNAFLVNLIDRIAFTFVRNVSLQNPLAKFKKGRVDLGKVIQEIFVDLTHEKKYDPEDAEDTVFKREIPNVKSLYHERNRRGRYDQTIQEEDLQTAFTSWNDFGQFVAGIINAIYNSAEVDEYKYMKLMIDNAYSKGQMTVIPVPEPDQETLAKEFIKKVRATYTKLTLPMGSRDYNALAVHTRSYEDGLHLFIDADLLATTDVDVLASAFNMDKANFKGNVTVIDGLASEGLQAVLVDEAWFQVYDNHVAMRTIYNPKGLYWNYFYHVWQTLSTSRFMNAVAFVSGDVEPVTQAIINPPILSIKQGKDFKYEKFVRLSDLEYEVADELPADGGKFYTETWNVTSLHSDPLTGTSIDEGGNLTVGADQTGTLKVTYTVTFSHDGEEKSHTGESLVTVIEDYE